MKKILITGNSGYIGSHLSNRLCQQDNLEIYGLDRNLPKVKVKDHSWNDISRTGHFSHSVNNVEFDCVIHLAAEVAVGRSVLNPIDYYSTNVQGTLRVLRELKFKRFVFASTGSAGPMNNPYGISKRAGEQIVDQYCREKRIPFTTFRFYNVTGSDGFEPRPDGLFSKLIQAQQTGIFDLYGNNYNTADGSAVRDYTHVNEICSALESAVDTSTNQIEGLGHGIGTTVGQMIDVFKKVNGCDFDIRVCARREGDLERSVLDNPSPFMQKLYSLEQLLKV